MVEYTDQTKCHKVSRRTVTDNSSGPGNPLTSPQTKGFCECVIGDYPSQYQIQKSWDGTVCKCEAQREEGIIHGGNQNPLSTLITGFESPCLPKWKTLKGNLCMHCTFGDEVNINQIHTSNPERKFDCPFHCVCRWCLLLANWAPPNPTPYVKWK